MNQLYKATSGGCCFVADLLSVHVLALVSQRVWDKQVQPSLIAHWQIPSLTTNGTYKQSHRAHLAQKKKDDTTHDINKQKAENNRRSQPSNMELLFYDSKSWLVVHVPHCTAHAQSAHSIGWYPTTPCLPYNTHVWTAQAKTPSPQPLQTTQKKTMAKLNAYGRPPTIPYRTHTNKIERRQTHKH